MFSWDHLTSAEKWQSNAALRDGADNGNTNVKVMTAIEIVRGFSMRHYDAVYICNSLVEAWSSSCLYYDDKRLYTNFHKFNQNTTTC